MNNLHVIVEPRLFQQGVKGAAVIGQNIHHQLAAHIGGADVQCFLQGNHVFFQQVNHQITAGVGGVENHGFLQGNHRLIFILAHHAHAAVDAVFHLKAVNLHIGTGTIAPLVNAQQDCTD